MSEISGEIQMRLEPDSLICCTSPMADENKSSSSSSKNIILWVITAALVALAIFLYKR